MHRRHDGARRFLAGLFQLDSIATDPALGSSSPPRIFMKRGLAAAVRADQPIAIPPPNFTETSEKRGVPPNCMAMPEATIIGRSRN